MTDDVVHSQKINDVVRYTYPIPDTSPPLHTHHTQGKKTRKRGRSIGFGNLGKLHVNDIRGDVDVYFLIRTKKTKINYY